MRPRPITALPPRWLDWRSSPPIGAVAVLCGLLLTSGSPAAAPVDRFTQPERDYILACGGCHGFRGTSNPTLVPSLKGLAGYFLYLPEGRAYLARLPNVAFSTLSDEQLADVLNYVVFDLGAGSAPPGSQPYGAAEVGRWRRQPLTEVSLSIYRGRLVETLIDRNQAPASLRGGY
jgi:mono/diheme cytochrome c family protein